MAETKKIKNASEYFYNPLAQLTQADIDNLFLQARIGNDAQLQYVYSLIEKHIHIYNVCIKNRLSGIQERKWEVVALDTNDSKSVEQAKVINDIFLDSDTRNEDGLTDAINHLAMYAFRGRSCVKSFFKDNKLYFKSLDNWNILYKNGDLYFNPQLKGYFSTDYNNDVKYVDLVKVENPYEVTYITEDLPIDVCGLNIYLRDAVGEYNWARAIEKYGIAQILIKAAEGTPESSFAQLANRAMQIFEGGSGVLPNGTEVTQITDARGQDPFTSFIDHQEKLIAILATGGALNTLGGATGLGSNLAETQDTQFDKLVSADAKKISNAITNTVVRKVFNALYPYDEMKIRFSFVDKESITTNEYLDYALKLFQMGVPLDITKLKEITGLQFIKDDSLYVVPKKDEVESKEWTDEEKQELKKDLI